MITCTRRLEIDAGHRVTGHESKCRNVHGHRYAFEVTVGAPELDPVGRVVDFGAVKAVLGTWLDEQLDHGYVHHHLDAVGATLAQAGHKTFAMPQHLGEPTAENLATLVGLKAIELLPGLQVVSVRCWETPNCYADWTAEL